MKVLPILRQNNKGMRVGTVSAVSIVFMYDKAFKWLLCLFEQIFEGCCMIEQKTFHCPIMSFP